MTKDMESLPLSEDEARKQLSVGQEMMNGWPGSRPKPVRRVWELMVEDYTTHAISVKRMWTDTPWAEREELTVFPLVLGRSLDAYPQITTGARSVLAGVQWMAVVRAFVVGIRTASAGQLTWFAKLHSLLKTQRMPPLVPDDNSDAYRQQAESGLCAAGIDPYLAQLAARLMAEHSSRRQLGIELRRLLSRLAVSDMQDLEAHYLCCEDVLTSTVHRPEAVRALMAPVEHGVFRALLIGCGLGSQQAAPDVRLSAEEQEGRR